MTSEIPPADPRVLDVGGAHNLRDLGGLLTSDGGRIRTGRVFRSDYPFFAEADAEGARRLGLRTVVDLRRGSEAALEQPDWEAHGIACEQWPLSAGRESSWEARYPSYLVHRPETVVGAVRAVMRPDNHAVLFHCAAGKDRTGVVAALLLSVLGVPPADIMADYVLSAPSVEPVLARLLERDLYVRMLTGSSVQDQIPREEHLETLLGWLTARGGAVAWLVDQGVASEELTGFRAAMVEE